MAPLELRTVRLHTLLGIKPLIDTVVYLAIRIGFGTLKEISTHGGWMV